MQSTEEYLDQLLASVSGEETEAPQPIVEEQSKQSIEDLDETELTEEALQEQLAMLLGLEIEKDEPEETEDFMSQYAAQIMEDIDAVEEIQEEVQVEAYESVQEEVQDVQDAVTPVLRPSDTGVLSADEIAALFASMNGDDGATETIESLDTVEEFSVEIPETTDTEVFAVETVEDAAVEEQVAENVQESQNVSAPQISESGVLSPDEIAALFASMGVEEPAVETKVEEEAGAEASVEIIPETISIEEAVEAIPEPEQMEEPMVAAAVNPMVQDDSPNRMMSPDEIAALFASMSAEEPVADKSTEIESAEDYADLKGSEDDIQEIPDLNLDEETLLDLENVDALLEATAKQAEDSGSGDDMLAMEEKMEEDIFSMLAQFEEESAQETMAKSMQSDDLGEVMSFDEEEGIPSELLTEESAGDNKGKKKKKEKVKKEKVKKEKVKKEKPEKKNKVSLKDKFMAFAFDDDDEDAEVGAEESMEASADKKKQKPKKEKAGKKNKKADKGKPQDENAAIEAELAEEDRKKKQKKEKPVKEKKVKPPKREKTPEELEAERREERHSIKTGGIAATLLVCASILVLILVGTYFVPKHLSLLSARVAFYAGNYEEVTMRLEGRNLNDSDRLMYEKSNLLYGLQERYHQYEIYMKRQMPKEALNALLQGLAACKEETILAEQLGIVTEWKVIKEQFEDALMQQYGLDVQTSNVISELRNPAYTIAVENILAGKSYDDMSAYGGSAKEEPVVEEDHTSEEEQTPVLEDLLPEEEAILEQMQQENGTLPEQETAGGQETSSDEEGRELYSGTVNGGSVNFAD